MSLRFHILNMGAACALLLNGRKEREEIRGVM